MSTRQPPAPIWYAVVDDKGRLHAEAADLLRRYLLGFAGRAIQMVIRPRARVKSKGQLGYWHGVIIPILADHFGYRSWEHDAVHDAVMRHLRGEKPEPNPLHARVSMAEMTHAQVSELIEDARHWALTSHGVTIPDAEKVEAA